MERLSACLPHDLCSRKTAGHVVGAAAISLLAVSCISLLGVYSRSPVRMWSVEGGLLTGLVKYLFLEKLTAFCGGLTAAYSTRALLGTGVGLLGAGSGLLAISSWCTDRP